MKRLIFNYLIIASLAVSAALTSCKDDEKTFTVNFNSGDGGSAVPSQTVKEGERATKPNNPARDGNTFVGWYKEAALTNEWNFATDVVSANITLYARWNAIVSAVTDLTITVSGEYLYTGEPVKPSGANVTVKANDVTLIAGTDYTLSYSNNLNTGTATLTATGTGYYKGSEGSENFTIAPKALIITGFNITKKFDGLNTVIGSFGTLSFSGLAGGETATVDAGDITADYQYIRISNNIPIIFRGGLFGMTSGTANPANYIVTQPKITGSITVPFEGSGSENFPYLIGTAKELMFLAMLVNAGWWDTGQSTSRVYLKLIDNIDLTAYGSVWNGGKGWIPIGESSMNSFYGHFDGDKHKVSGLYMNNSNSIEAGLFGNINGGTVRNLGVEGTVVGGSIIGALVGTAIGTNFGFNYSVNIINCYAAVAVSGSSTVGGLAGRVINGGILNCYATGDVSGSRTISTTVGGLVGSASGNVTNCYATGTISGVSYVGGISGDVYEKIENCAALNPIINQLPGGSNMYFGRVAGYGSGGLSPIINSVSWDGTTLLPDGTFDGGNGTDITTMQTKDIETYKTTLGWQFGNNETNPWKMGANGYPVFFWQE